MTATAAVTVDLSLPAIPAMADALSTTLSRAQKIVGVFMLGMALGQIPSGLAADRFGRLPALYGGLSLFTLAATFAAVANSIELMLAARFVQGIGAATSIVIARAIVRDVASGKEAAKLMSLMTMIFTAAPVIAPSIGALLVARWNWHAPFVAIAACGYLMFVAVRTWLVETHRPDVSSNPARQLVESVAEFFSHRQSVFAFLLMIFIPAGFMSMITVSAALAVEIYGYSVQQYGLIFATAGISILLGSAANRWLVERWQPLQLVAFGVAIAFVASLQLAIIAWLDTAPFLVDLALRLPVHVYRRHHHRQRHRYCTRPIAAYSGRRVVHSWHVAKPDRCLWCTARCRDLRWQRAQFGHCDCRCRPGRHVHVPGPGR